MAVPVFDLSEYRRRIGQRLGSSHWVTITQDMIDQFGRVTLDPDPMHIDPQWCEKHSPFTTTIAFGFLTVSLLTHLLHDVLQYGRDAHVGAGGYGLNYGFDHLRLVAPVPVGARVRGHFTLAELRERGPGEVIQAIDCEIEVEGREKPALVARWLSLLVNEPGHERIKANAGARSH